MSRMIQAVVCLLAFVASTRGELWLFEPFDYQNGNLNESAMYPTPQGFDTCVWNFFFFVFQFFAGTQVILD